MTGLGILCPGQGDQTPDMFALFADHEDSQRLLRTGAAQLWGDPAAFARHAQDEAAFDNILAQPLICLRQLVAWRALAPRLPKPRVFAGYSLGEFAAYGCAGALSLEETLQLSKRRAALMDAVVPKCAAGLLALRGLHRKQVDEFCQAAGVAIAIVNGADHFVVGGFAKALDEVAKLAAAAGADTVRWLPVTVPSHTSLLAIAGKTFLAELESSNLQPPPIPILAGIDGAVVRDRQAAVMALADQVCRPLRWDLCQQAALEMGCGVFLEMGPGNALSRMLRDASPGVQVRSIDEFRSLQGVVDWVVKRCIH